MKYYITFPVGDVSCDGHNYYATFLVRSEKASDFVRSVHFNHNHFISNICNEYEDKTVSVEYLKKGCLQKENSTEKSVNAFLAKMIKKHNFKFDDDEDCEDEMNAKVLIVETPENMIILWTELLNWFDTSLKLKIVSEALSSYKIKYQGYKYDIEGSMDHYDINKLKETINLPGYGVWNDGSDSEFHHDVS